MIRRLMGVTLAASIALPLPADEIRLVPGVIEGKVVEESSDFIRVETATGLIAIPTSVIKLRLAGPSRSERYSEMQSVAPLTPARHAEIAAWCFEVGLIDQGRDHVATALEEDPQCAEALTLAGYVRLGDVWLKAGDMPSATPAKTAKPAPDAMLEVINAGWLRRVNTLFEAMKTDTPGGADFAASRARLISIRDPIILPIVSRVLESGPTAIRLTLIEVLAGSPEETATMHLLVLAVLDANVDVRRAAVAALGKRPGRAASDWLRGALRCAHEGVVGRAAEALGWLKDRSAMSDLVDHLSTGRTQPPRVSVRAVFDALTAAFDDPIVVPLGGQTAEIPCRVAFNNFGRRVDRLARNIERPTGTHRTEVQDALMAITGENFGFDVAAWREWIARNPPIDPGIP